VLIGVACGRVFHHRDLIAEFGGIRDGFTDGIGLIQVHYSTDKALKAQISAATRKAMTLAQQMR